MYLDQTAKEVVISRISKLRDEIGFLESLINQSKRSIGEHIVDGTALLDKKFPNDGE